MNIMDKHPLLETLFELHKRDHYVDKILSTFHFVFVSEKLYKNNRLIDWHDADKGFGHFHITYVNENSTIRCLGIIDAEKFDMTLESDYHTFPIHLKKNEYLEHNGSGGLYAIVLSLYFNYPAITFSSTGVEDIVNIYSSDLFMDNNKQSVIPPIFNFAHVLDPIPQLDCQLGTLCMFESEDIEKQEKLTDAELESLHLSIIFGIDEPHIIQWLRQPERWTCTTANNYSLKYGSCKRERLRWKDRMKLNSIDEQTIKPDL